MLNNYLGEKVDARMQAYFEAIYWHKKPLSGNPDKGSRNTYKKAYLKTTTLYGEPP